MTGNLDQIRIMTINPFWRWAVIPLTVVGDAPAISFMTRRAAERFAREFLSEARSNRLRAGGIQILRRSGLRSYELAGVIRDER
jgi:hypothetical protein